MNKEAYELLQRSCSELPGVEIYPPIVKGEEYNERFVEITIGEGIRLQQIAKAIGRSGLLDGDYNIGEWGNGRLKIIGVSENSILLEDLSYRGVDLKFLEKK